MGLGYGARPCFENSRCPFRINFKADSSKVGKHLHSTVKPVLVATSIKQATCIKQACIQFPKKANTLKFTCI